MSSNSPFGQLRPVEPPEIVSRTGWKASPPDHQASDEYGLFHPQDNPGGWLVYQSPLDTVLHTIVVHHSALDPAVGVAEIQQLHMGARGFADIAYHFVVDAGGAIYEGRPIGVRGAHVRAANTGSVGVVLLGNFEEQPPLRAQVIALHHLTGYLAETYSGITHLAGHYQFNAETVCPGAACYGLLPVLAGYHGLQCGVGGYRLPLWA